MAKKDRNKTAKVYKRIELIGISTEGFEDAINNAISKASETLSGLSWFEVKELRGSISNSQVREYQATVVINFEVQ